MDEQNRSGAKRFAKKPLAKRTFDKKPFDKKHFDSKNADRKPVRGGSYAKRPQIKPAGDRARDVALRALRDVVRENAYAAQALDRALAAAKLADEDRRLAASLFYTALENRLRIDRVIARFTKTRPDPEIIDILHIAAAQILFMDKIPDHAAVDEAVKQARRAHREGMTALVNAVLRAIIRARDAGELALVCVYAAGLITGRTLSAFLGSKWRVG